MLTEMTFWQYLRIAGTFLTYAWLTVTAPIRLVVWLAEAVVVIAAAGIICLAAGWLLGWIPDDFFARHGQVLMAKLTRLLQPITTLPLRPGDSH